MSLAPSPDSTSALRRWITLTLIALTGVGCQPSASVGADSEANTPAHVEGNERAPSVVSALGSNARYLNPVTLADLNDNPTAPYRRTFADPLPLGQTATLLFERDGMLVRRIEWATGRVSAVPLGDALPLKEGNRRYTAVASTSGLWLVGPTVLLLRPDGSRSSLPFDAYAPAAVALPDGSLLVMGDNRDSDVRRLRRLVSDGTSLRAHDLVFLPANASLRYGVNAVTLGDGSVFLAGDDQTPADGIDPGSPAFLLDPMSGHIQTLPPMPHARAWPVLLPLPDGRVLAAGAASGLGCYDAGGRTVDVYEPRSKTWSTLPSLPFPLCSGAWGSQGPSGTVLADGSVVLGGHLERHVLLLRREKAGYATFWEVVGTLPKDRWGGTVQAIGPHTVAVAGGVYRHEDGCCAGTPGANRIDLPVPNEMGASHTLALVGTGSAQRGKRVLLAGGRAFRTTNSGQMRYSSLVELMDLSTGKVRQMPSMPFPAGAPQVVWLDDTRVMVKDTLPDNDRGFEPIGNLASRIPAGSGALAILNVASGQWSKPINSPAIARSQLVHAQGNEALLLTEDMLYRLDLVTRRLIRLTPSLGRHTDVTARRLSDGRVLLTGGWMQDEFMSLITASRTVSPEQSFEEPEVFTGWGALLPSRRAWWWLPDADTVGSAEEGTIVAGGTTLPFPFNGYKTPDWREKRGDMTAQTSAPSSAEATRLTKAASHWHLGPASKAGDATQAVTDVHGRMARLIRLMPTQAQAVGRILGQEQVEIPSQGDAEMTEWIDSSSLMQMLELADRPEGPWRTNALPDGVLERNVDNVLVACVRDCRLLSVPDPRHSGEELLFLREGGIDRDWFWENFERGRASSVNKELQKPFRVWWFDRSTDRWHLVLQASAEDLCTKPLPLGEPLASKDQPLMSLGWHLRQPLVWQPSQP